MKYDRQCTIEYYDTHASTYDEDGIYPANRVRLKLASDILGQLPRGKLLDAGCGTGKLLEVATQKGFNCVGCDFSGGMLNQAKKILTGIPLIQASLDNLSMFEDESFDHVFCLGVLPYIPEEQETNVYRELRRVIKPGGYFISAHQNELFDLFSFNKYTLRFFERNFFISTEYERAAIASLITNPNEPINKNGKNSARDIVFTKPENPLLYPDKLKKHCFAHKEFLYYNFHSSPPLLRNGNIGELEKSKNMEVVLAREWQGMFMASTFISVAQAL